MAVPIEAAMSFVFAAGIGENSVRSRIRARLVWMRVWQSALSDNATLALLSMRRLLQEKHASAVKFNSACSDR